MRKALMNKTKRSFAIVMSMLMILSSLPFVVQKVHAEEVPLVYQFDFGTSTSPVKDGFKQVHNNLLYTVELGYGLNQAIVSRDRSGGDGMTNDFVLGAQYTFKADIPNGKYAVTVYSGDMLAGTSSTRTNVTLEGVAVGSVSSRQAVNQATFETVVSDGQLTVDITGSGVGGYLNGLVIEEVVPVPPATPESLMVTGVLTTGEPTVSLQWTSVTDAVYYKLYRSVSPIDSFEYLAESITANYNDNSVSIGSSYSYQVTAVNHSGLESSPSNSAAVEVLEPTEPPAAPENLLVSQVAAGSVTLQWSASAGAAQYAIYRSNAATGTFAEIARVDTITYTDLSVDTSMIWHYQVKAYNGYGESEGSNIVESSVHKPPQGLPEQFPIQLDFGSGALAEGYIPVSSGVAYSPEWKYGFTDPSKVDTGDRASSDPLKTDFVMPVGSDFLVDLPNGDYAVTLIAGDATEATEIGVVAETITKIPVTVKAAGDYLQQTFQLALIDGQLNLTFTGSTPKVNGLIIAKLPERIPGEIPTVYIAGDSTVQSYDEFWKPEAGWGQMIPRYFSSSVAFDNHAIGGRSSKSFIFEGRLDTILRKIQPNDYFMIQFGHNDATISVPERYASVPDFKNYLKAYVNGARQRGATPILVTPVGRRDFNASTGKFNVSFPEYVAGMKEVAQELNVKLVDLSTLSVAYYDSIGPVGTLSVFLHTEPGIYQAFPNGSADNTHFQEYGAIQLARLLAGAIEQLGLPLSAYVADVGEPAELPAIPTGLAASNISNAGAVLNWNEVDGADIYKIYRKKATDTEYALIGTSTIPHISIIGMIEGETYHVRVTAVNGKGESEPSEIVTIDTKKSLYKYDFGLAGTPVAEGYSEVNLSTLYTKERGYGIVSSAGMIGRDRNAGGDLLRDWLGYFNVGWHFNVDLPNGLYSVKVYVGDFSGSARTTVAVEGQDYGQVAAPRNNYSEKVIPEVSVKDGQMNFYFGGSTGIVNGLEITPILLAPSGLAIDDLSLNPDAPSVTFSWQAVEEAKSYNVYRRASGTNKDVLLGNTVTNSWVDTTVDVGMEFEYRITTVDQTNSETVPSLPLTVSMIDPAQPVPAVPTDLAVGDVNKIDVTISWGAVQNAITYNIYRSKKEDGVYQLIDKTRETIYTDLTVLTTIPYYYKVAAVNAGGVSELSTSIATPAVTVLKRQMEHIDRSLVAIHTEQGVYVGWRMLGLDTMDIAFNVYRDGVKVNDEPLVSSTNLLDEAGTIDSKYKVYTVINGVQTTVSKEVSVWQNNYLSVAIDKPADDVTKDEQPYTYNAGDASVGDLDGDGTYEIVMLWNPSNSKDNSQAGYTGIVYMDAYKLDGTRLWRINLGPNIRAGAHYTQFMVYDLDGDGKAEVSFKTADGTVDGEGNVIGRADVDHRNSSGYILLGAEYLTVFDGETGRALATTEYDPPRGDVSSWGDGYGNRVDRFLAAVAYLDGERPSLIMSRGYYTRTVLAAYNYRDGQLSKVWRFDSNDEGNGSYAGQGNHNLSVGDVDGDGKDEISFGAMAVDDDGTGLYSTGLGHGDAMHLGDLDPSRPGLELFDVHEHTDSPYGMEMRDAATGEILWGIHTGIDTGRGLSADIDPNHLGEESWSANITNEQHIQVTGLHNTKGELISSVIPTSTNFGVWWDGDLLRELQDHNRIDKWDYVNQSTTNLFTAVGSSSNNSTKANPSLQADLFGDWREEIIWRANDSSELRIFSTTDLTEHRIRTLMHDPIYRLGVAWQNVSYNQPPHPSFHLGVGMSEPPMPNIVLLNNDITPPQTGHSIIGETKGGWYATPVTVELIAEDGGTGAAATYYSINEGAVQEGTSVAVALEGTHSLTFWSLDAAGNIEAAQTIGVKLDLSGPEIVLSVADGTQYSINETVHITCEVTDNASGVATSSCEEINAAAYTLEPGTHTFRVEAIDNAGNQSSKSINIVITVDFDGLIALTEQLFSNNGSNIDILNTLIEKLVAAQSSDIKGNTNARDGQIGAFINQLEAQSGKAIPAEQAEILIGLAQSLMQ